MTECTTLNNPFYRLKADNNKLLYEIELLKHKIEYLQTLLRIHGVDENVFKKVNI